MTGAISANALGDPRVFYAGLVQGDDADTFLEQIANRQRELRAMIPPGGRRAMYLEHLHALAEDSGTILSLYHPKGFIAQWRGETQRLPGMPPEITTPLPLTRAHYLTGLHEFGHVYNPDLRGTSHHGVTAEGIYGELMAHLWAFEHSKVPIAEQDLRHAKDSLFLDAVEIGWSGGPVADLLPRHLRKPYSDGLARLDQYRSSAEAGE